MNLLEHYKESYYKELERLETLNSKISISITFLTIIGSALTYIFNKTLEFKLGFEFLPTLTVFFTLVCFISFCITCYNFYASNFNYEYSYFPIEDFNNFIIQCKSLDEYSEDEINQYISKEYQRLFYQMSIENQSENIKKSKAHYRLSRSIIITLILLLITYISLCITIKI